MNIFISCNKFQFHAELHHEPQINDYKETIVETDVTNYSNVYKFDSEFYLHLLATSNENNSFEKQQTLRNCFDDTLNDRNKNGNIYFFCKKFLGYI